MPTAQKRNPNQTKETTQKRHATRSVRQGPVELTEQFDPAVLQRAMAAPRLLRPADAQALQRTVGNRAVTRLLAGSSPQLGNVRPSPPPVLQAKLMVGPVGDRYEQDANRVAQQVMSMPAPAGQQPAQRQEEEGLQMKPLAASITPLVQRQEEGEELAQIKPVEALQLQGEEKEEPAQMQAQPTLEGGEIASDLESAIQSARGGGQPLPDTVRGPMEQAFGAEFSSIRIHADSQSDTINRSLTARAFTTGQDIFFRQGAYNPHSTDGRELLAHELTHTIQQTGSQPLQGHQINSGRISTHLQRMGNVMIQRVLDYPDVVKRFKPGDLMYGLKFARPQAPIKRKLEALDTTGKNVQQAASVLDELNNYFIGTGNIGGTSKKQYGMAYGTKLPTYKGSAEVIKRAKTFKKWLETDPNFKDKFTGKVDVRNIPITDRLRTWERIKQVCKAGLYYTTKIKKGHIFFFLDGLNMADVVNKTQYNKMDEINFDPRQYVDKETGDSREDITPAELRYLFRNRNDRGIMDDVSFWKGGKKVDSPWKDRPALWQKYEDQRLDEEDDEPKQKTRPNQPTTTTEEINAIRDRVLKRLEDRKWVYAAKHAIDLNLDYVRKGILSRKLKGLGKLDSIRHEAKNISADDTDREREDTIADIAARAYAASAVGRFRLYKGSMLNIVRKIAFYLIRRLPEEHIRKGAVYQAQIGVTGKSKLSASPTALLMMGVGAGAKAAIIQRLVRDPGDWVEADPNAVLAALPAYKESVARGNDISESTKQAGQDISKDIVARAMKQHRNLFYNATGFDETYYSTLINALRQTDYRIKLVLVHEPEEGFNDPGLRDQAGHIPWHFQKLYALADEAHIYNNKSGLVEWKLGMGGTPIEKIKEIEARAREASWQPTSEVSYAGDPKFESEAIKFEERLGAYAFGHAKAKNVTKEMADKIITYMDKRGELYEKYEKLGKTIDEFESEATWKTIGSFSTRIAGAVGLEVKKIKKALEKGNVRERMTHIHNFMDNVLGKDLTSGKKQKEIEQIITESDMNLKRLQERKIGEKEKLSEALPKANKALKERENIRIRSRQRGESDRSARDVPGLSKREKAFMNIQNETDKVTWNEGIKAWFANELHEWVEANRELSLPIAAGPSGHTNSFMQIAQYLGVEKPDYVRLAIIGHLLPIRAHSLVEIMEVAASYGAKYTPGQQMYTDIRPLKEEDLRKDVAIDGKFPHEIVAEG